MPVVAERSTAVCCQDIHIKSCVNVDFDLSILEDKEIKLLGKLYKFSNYIPPNGIVFKNSDGDEAVLGVNKEKATMFGSIHMGNLTYGIEHCGNGHIFKEYDVASFTEDNEKFMGGKQVI